MSMTNLEVANAVVEELDMHPKAALDFVNVTLDDIERVDGRVIDHDNISQDDVDVVFDTLFDKTLRQITDLMLDNMLEDINELRHLGEESLSVISNAVHAAALIGAPLGDIARVTGLDKDTVQDMANGYVPR